MLLPQAPPYDMLFFRGVCTIVVAIVGASLGTGCGSSTGPAPADGGTADRGTVDAAQDGGADAAGDGSSQNPCAPGTCRFRSDPGGQCLPPGGPLTLPDSGPSLSGCCACGSDGFCSSECVCASPETPIATPEGDRPIASLSVGDLVLSIDQGRVAAVPIREVHRTPVANHRVIEVVLQGGAVLHVSAAHPTADGRTFGTLRAGDWLGGREVASARVVPYPHEATYDILPDSDTATYFAAGALIGSTLARTASHEHLAGTCSLPSVAAPR